MENILQKLNRNWKYHILAANTKKDQNSKIIKKPLTLLISVSGGCDSIALLHLLHHHRRLLKIDPHIIHFNHQLRPESSQEERFVKSLAEQYKIPFHNKTATHLKSGQSALQESARNWRIKESLNLIKNLGGGRIATGHHADDQVETMLLKWLRGAHISNLKGMEWIKGDFIRPLLNFRKSELKDYLKKNHLKWMEDKSNQNKTYLRNRIRIELIPLLEKLTRDSLHSRINDLSEQSKTLRELLELNSVKWQKKYTCEAHNELPVKELQESNNLIKQEILYNFITKSTGISLSYQELKKIFAQLGRRKKFWEIRLSGKWTLRKSDKLMSLEKNQ